MNDEFDDATLIVLDPDDPAFGFEDAARYQAAYNMHPKQPGPTSQLIRRRYFRADDCRSGRFTSSTIAGVAWVMAAASANSCRSSPVNSRKAMAGAMHLSGNKKYRHPIIVSTISD